jgi:hypothetical protein
MIMYNPHTYTKQNDEFAYTQFTGFPNLQSQSHSINDNLQHASHTDGTSLPWQPTPNTK